MNYTEQQILLGFLIFVRFTAMFFAAPVFSLRGIPNILKVGLGILFTLLVFPVVEPTGPNFELTLVSSVVLLFSEILTGLTIGLIINFIFAGVELAGEYIGVDMGFAMAREFDPLFNEQVSVIAKLKNIVAVLIFILIDGHHFLIEAVTHSFNILPIGSWEINPLAIEKIIQLSASIFVIGIKIAAPAIVTLFLTSVAMGLTARAVPQMNIFFVGFPVRIAAGFFSLLMMFPLFFYLFKKLLVSFQNDVIYLLKVM